MIEFCAVGRFLGLAGYFFFDHWVWAIKVCGLSGNSRALSRTGLAAQLFSLVCTFALDFRIAWELMLEAAILLREQQRHARKAARRARRSASPPLPNNSSKPFSPANAAAAHPKSQVHAKRLLEIVAKQRQLWVGFDPSLSLRCLCFDKTWYSDCSSGQPRKKWC